MLKNMNELAVELTKREGGKVNLSIAQIKEVIGHLSDIIYEENIKFGPEQEKVNFCNMLLLNGSHRALDRKNKG